MSEIQVMAGDERNTGRGNGRGPTWMWIAGVVSAVCGSVLAAIGVVVWSQVSEMARQLDAIHQTLVELKDASVSQSQVITHDSDQIVKLWERLATEHEIIMQDHYKLSVDDDWIAAQSRANRAIRELHSR